jgi:hypothetical protein
MCHQLSELVPVLQLKAYAADFGDWFDFHAALLHDT